MKKKLALCITAVLLVCLCAGGVTAMAAESELGASAACEGHTLGTFNGVPACVNENGDLHVCENNFPDSNFRNYNFTVWSTGQSAVNDEGYITAENVKNVRYIIVRDRGIVSLRGVEFFTYIEGLTCNENKLTQLNVSNNTELISLLCGNNELTELDVSKNRKLHNLDCRFNKLNSLTLCNNQNFTSLICNDNKLKELDLSNLNSLYGLNCSNNNLLELDLSKNTELTSARCSYQTAIQELKLVQIDAIWKTNLGDLLPQDKFVNVTVPAGEYDPVTGDIEFANEIDSFNYMYDVGNNDIKMTVNVSLIKESALTDYGDANGDGVVDMSDITLLMQYMANYDYDTGTSTMEVGAGADANGDGTVDMSDITLLMQYMANYDYDTGSSTVILGPKN